METVPFIMFFYYNHPEQPNFKKAAETAARDSTSKVIMIGVSTESDFKSEWANLRESGTSVGKVSIFSHGSKTEGGFKGSIDIGELNFKPSDNDDGALNKGARLL